MRNCPKCSSQDTVKSGKIKGRQRYRCKGCQYHYTVIQKSDIRSDDTFAKTYSVLIENIENLFLEFLPSLLTDTWTAKKQRRIGTHHYVRDLPTNFSGWNSVITEELSRLDNEGLVYDSQ